MAKLTAEQRKAVNERITRAWEIVNSYRSPVSDGFLENFTDLLADLMHLADSRGDDFDAYLSLARAHFNAEASGRD